MQYFENYMCSTQQGVQPAMQSSSITAESCVNS